MRAFFIFCILVTSSWAKTDFCDFNSDFAEKYMEARKNYARHLREKRQDPESKATPGSARSREFKDQWPEASMKDVIKRLYKDAEVEIAVKPNGKMMVYPKNLGNGDPLIIFDSSGDYFRVAQAHINKSGVIRDVNSYFDLDGKPIPSPLKTDSREAYLKFINATHYRAIP